MAEGKRFEGRNNPHWKGGPSRRACIECGRDFKIPHAWLRKRNRGKFCSRKCMGTYHSKTRVGGRSANWRGGPVRRVCRNCGKPFDIRLSPSTIKRNRGRFCSKKCHYEWLSENLSGENNPFYGKTHSKEELRKWIESLKLKPNRSEKLLDSIIQKNDGGEWKYNGDFRCGVFIGGRIPDWANMREKKVIELFGRLFHDPDRSPIDIPFTRTEEGTIRHYAKYGYKCLVIWDDELRNTDEVSKKILAF